MDKYTTIVLIAVNLVLGVSAGIIMHRSDFCMAGKFRDLFLFREVFMLRRLFLPVIMTMAMVEPAGISGCSPFSVSMAVRRLSRYENIGKNVIDN